MGMLEKIFGKREQPAALKNAQTFRLLEGYTPAFTTWRGSIYESELIRAALDTWGRHAAKLKPNVKGAAVPELQNRLVKIENILPAAMIRHAASVGCPSPPIALPFSYKIIASCIVYHLPYTVFV